MGRFLAILFLGLGAQSFGMLDCPTTVRSYGMDRAQAYFVIVDGYNSGSLYAPALRQLGFRLVHVHGARNSPGEIEGLQNIEWLKQLPSYQNHRIKAAGNLVRTVDLATAPGSIYLCHESEAQIEADTRKIREMNFFVLKP